MNVIKCFNVMSTGIFQPHSITGKPIPHGCKM